MPRIRRARNFKRVGYLRLPGGGQVVVDGSYAYVAHMSPPHGTSIVDVSDPARPRLVSQIRIPGDIHSHKVRVAGDIMLVNNERFPPGDASRSPEVGLRFYDVSDRTRPKECGFFPTHGRGAHRFDLQGTRAFLSTEWEGFASNILAIVDFSDPTRPSLIGRWWLPGQEGGGDSGGGGEDAAERYWVHLALVRGDRAYAACGNAGAVIVDISDPQHPAPVGSAAWSPPYVSPTHTFLPVPHRIRNRRFAVVTDEDVTDTVLEDPPAFMWVLDITNEARPVPVATYQVEPDAPVTPGPGRRFGAHQPWEHIREDNIAFVAWFSGGVRAVDISNPYAPREAGFYVPPAPGGRDVPQTNDIFVDHRGLVYAIDRYQGLSVLEFRP